MRPKEHGWRFLLDTFRLAYKYEEELGLTFDRDVWTQGVIHVIQNQVTSSKLKGKALCNQIDALIDVVRDDEECLAMLQEYVVSQSVHREDSNIDYLLHILETFEKVGLKKVPERLSVLKVIKDKIESD